MGTPRDFCEAQYLQHKAKRAGFYVDGGWGAIVLRALPATAKRFGLVPDADLCRVDSIEAAIAWLSGWTDHEIYTQIDANTKRAKRSKEARRV